MLSGVAAILPVRPAHARPSVIDARLLEHGPWAEAARQAGGIDPWLLYAVSLYETASFAAPGLIRPHPWSLNFAGTEVRCATREEAANRLAGVTPATNVDIGLMQINWATHHARAISPAALLDPLANLFVGADILRIALASAGLDLVLGVGRYHSWDEALARPYGLGVVALYLRLRRYLSSGQGAPG